MFKSTGILQYFDNPYKLWVKIDTGIADYYRNQIPLKTNRPKYAPHISVVRNLLPTIWEFWGKYEGKEVVFGYEHYVYNDEKYFWLNIICRELEDIRAELGLVPHDATTFSHDGMHVFHSTIANCKNL